MKSARQRLEIFFEKHPREAKRSLGQNFLISDRIIEKILEATQSLRPEKLIEVGPGPGALTEILLTWKLPLTLIELDRDIAAHWRELSAEVIEGDALQISWSDLLSENSVLVSNLPYQISSSLVIDRCLDSVSLAGMVLMFQKEVAQRIRAQASSEDYGMLSVIAQNFWEISLVSEAGPRDFDPPPRVASRVLIFKRKSSPILNRQGFLNFVKIAFAQRRKQLKKNLSAHEKIRQDENEKLNSWLESRGKALTVRAEELSPEELKDLYFHFELE